jgi:DNA gyrase/topoisomerase IV subunit A
VHTQDLGIEDLIAQQDMVVTLSHGGYFKRQPLAITARSAAAVAASRRQR